MVPLAIALLLAVVILAVDPTTTPLSWDQLANLGPTVEVAKIG